MLRIQRKRSSVEVGSCGSPLREHWVSPNLLDTDRALQCGDELAFAAGIRAEPRREIRIVI